MQGKYRLRKADNNSGTKKREKKGRKDANSNNKRGRSQGRDRGSGEHIKELNNEKEKIMHIKIE